MYEWVFIKESISNNYKSKFIHLPPLKEGDMSRRKPDITKMNTVLNRKIISLEEGIIKTYNKLKNKN